MSLFQGLRISGSALTANRLRLDVIASNIANADTTRARLVDGNWEPYRKKTISMAPATSNSFASHLEAAMGKQSELAGVKVTSITEDPSPFRRVYDPDHPDADADGYVNLPNVDILKEMVDLISATRSYEANVTALNATKAMYIKALEIGK